MERPAGNTGNTEVYRSFWWLYYALGVALILFGIFAMIALYVATVGVQMVIATALILGAVIYAVLAVKRREETGTLHMLGGLLLAFLIFDAGVMLLAYPTLGLRILGIVLGVLFIIQGILAIIWSVRLRHVWSWWLGVLSGLVSLGLAAVVFLRYPRSTGWNLGVFLGIDLIVAGLVLMAFASQIRGATSAGVPRPATGHA